MLSLCVCVCPFSLPGRLFQNAPLIKVGQVCDGTLFLSESNFQVLPIRWSQYLRKWFHGEESPSSPFVTINLCWTAGECPIGWLVLWTGALESCDSALFYLFSLLFSPFFSSSHLFPSLLPILSIGQRFLLLPERWVVWAHLGTFEITNLLL